MILETVLTNEILIEILEIIALAGFGFLSLLTFKSYSQIKAKMLLYIALAFLVIFISLLFELSIPLIEDLVSFDEAYLEIIAESIQFIAAFLFLTGLKLIKK